MRMIIKDITDMQYLYETMRRLWKKPKDKEIKIVFPKKTGGKDGK